MSLGLAEVGNDLGKEITKNMLETVENKLQTGKTEWLNEAKGLARNGMRDEIAKTYRDVVQAEGAVGGIGIAVQNDETVVDIATKTVQSRMDRTNNIVIHRMPEEVIPGMDLSKREEKVLHDRTIVIEFCNTIGITCYDSEIEEVRRIGKYEGSELGKARPMLVTLKGNIKERVMRNLYKIKASKSEYTDIFTKVAVTHDMTKEEREREKELREEAKEKNAEEMGQGNFYVIRGRPWNRYLLKLKRRESTDTGHVMQ